MAATGLAGRDTLAWCERLGADDPKDALALTYLLWLVRDRLALRTPRTADELVTTALLSDQPS